MSRPGTGPTGGARTAWPASATTSSGCAWRSALWNGRDPVLKERLFGLTNSEGNHGEDVKECYFYTDAMPTSSYLSMLYKYPQAEFPYGDLVAVNGARGKLDPEYELLDTGIFDDGRYFDVEVEYAKAGPEDILMLVSVRNNGPDDAVLHVLPTLWFRHTWSWAGGDERPGLSATHARASVWCGRSTASSARAGCAPTARCRSS